MADVAARARELAAALAEPRAMRRGSVSIRFVKCGKAGCQCSTDPKARHGPYPSLTRAVAGKTHSRFLSAGQEEIARRQVEAGRQFRKRLEEYWRACEAWADAELEG